MPVAEKGAGRAKVVGNVRAAHKLKDAASTLLHVWRREMSA